MSLESFLNKNTSTDEKVTETSKTNAVSELLNQPLSGVRNSKNLELYGCK